MGIIVQKIKKNLEGDITIAQKYYEIISVINDLKLTQRDIELVAYTAVYGNISYKHLKEDFCNRYNTSIFTINNIVYKLKKLGVMIKVKGKIKVNPVIALDFKKNISLAISLEHETI